MLHNNFISERLICNFYMRGIQILKLGGKETLHYKQQDLQTLLNLTWWCFFFLIWLLQSHLLGVLLK